ncbi:putative Ig domain-containing protein [Geomesophilobacter sediminis]|uniref:Putative Ig domain-containing protein n=1 Tax=Geomesophilobacter sediminis TaxID=2798584 RepID=A0A8J7S8Z7_9BACT|nr:putative Ig domain-containing protein [Geomesophilobacter sediminis]MBJ6727976.1 putative Ig domain-containing protein [Geomesophilobacter sediminis]
MSHFRLVILLFAMAVVTACGGGGGGGGNVRGQSQAPPLPTISGTPTVSVVVGNSYLFVPTATDAQSFSVVNKPSWASFDSHTGALTGTPTNANAGTTAAIILSATNTTGSASLAAFSITVLPSAQSATVTLGCTGTLGSQLSGIEVAIALPPGVNPLTSGGSLDPGAILPSGGAAADASVPAGFITYVPATATSSGSLRFTLVNNQASGFGVGEFATVHLVIAEGIHPAADSFVVTYFRPVELLGGTSAGVTATEAVLFP